MKKKKKIEKPREHHNHKPQPTPDIKRKRKTTKTNTHKTNKQTHEKYTGEVITMLKGMKKHEVKQHGKTLKHEAARSINRISFCFIYLKQFVIHFVVSFCFI